MPLIFSATFLLKLKIAQHRAKERLEESKLQTIILNQGEFNWFKKNKEISIDGKLFDVKSFSENDGKYQFKGIYDEDETALNKYLEKNSDQNKTATTHLLSSLFKMLQSLYPNDMMDPVRSVNISVLFAPLIPQHISSPFKDILTPPPQLLATYSF